MGVGSADGGIDEHLFLSEVLESCISFDQVNAGELLCMEHVSRRYQMWEEIRGSALREAESGRGADMLEERERYFRGVQLTRDLALVCPELTKWVAEEVKESSSVLKERRKARTEVASAKANNKKQS